MNEYRCESGTELPTRCEFFLGIMALLPIDQLLIGIAHFKSTDPEVQLRPSRNVPPGVRSVWRDMSSVGGSRRQANRTLTSRPPIEHIRSLPMLPFKAHYPPFSALCQLVLDYVHVKTLPELQDASQHLFLQTQNKEVSRKFLSRRSNIFFCVHFTRD